MPCDEIREISQSIAMANPDIMALALKGFGWNVTRTRDGAINFTWMKENRLHSGSIFAGKIAVLEGDEGVINQIKQAYAREVVTVAGKRFGWNLVKQGGPNPNKMALTRRK